jgi:hypothetical protein
MFFEDLRRTKAPNNRQLALQGDDEADLSLQHLGVSLEGAGGALCVANQGAAVNTRIALATTKKGTMSIDEYVSKMKAYADELAAAGKTLDDEELISFIITGLDLDYNPVISAALERADPISIIEFTSQLLTFEQRLNLYQGSSSSSSFSANMASWGRGGGRMFRGRGARGRGNDGRGRGSFNNNSSSGKQKVQC